MNKEKLFQFLYWLLYLGLFFVSGWFSSEGIVNYFSQSTSFFQREEINDKRPVITIYIESHKPNGILEYGNNTRIYYCPSYWESKFLATSCQSLNIGANVIPYAYKNTTKTEKVFFHKYKFRNIFRIIPLTNLWDKNPEAQIQIHTLKEFECSWVNIYVTSLENSQGLMSLKWNDGGYVSYTIPKNSQCV